MRNLSSQQKLKIKNWQLTFGSRNIWWSTKFWWSDSTNMLLVFGQHLLDAINEMVSWCPESEEFQNEIIDFGPQWYIGKSLGRDKEMEKWNKIFKIAFFYCWLLRCQIRNLSRSTNFVNGFKPFLTFLVGFYIPIIFPIWITIVLIMY